jgi:hypothetical protein
MTWLHPALLFGLGVVVAPVLLHFLMRQKPKKLVFPALRLVQQQRRSNARRFRLRHLWLLLLRMLALAAIVFAIARPTLPAANYGLNLREALILLGVIAAGVIAYYSILARWRSSAMPRHELALQRAKLRGWTTGLTLLSAAFLAGCPYQRRVSAEITAAAPTGQFDLPIAATFIFDNSLSLEYTQQGETRLAVAKRLAREHLMDFPAGSRVAVTEASEDTPVIFQASISAAQSRIDAIEPSAVTTSLNDRILAAANLQRDDRQRVASEGGAESLDRFLRRVYVFTDLAASAWRFSESTALFRAFEEQPGLVVQIVDVGELDPKNTSIGAVIQSAEVVTRDLPLSISADIVCKGEGGERRAVLSLMTAGGQFVPRDSQVRTLEPGQPQRFDFALLSGLAGPVVHGEIRLQSTDPLAFDDVRSFTAVVGAAPRVLLVAPTERETIETRAALEIVGFEPVIITPMQLNTADVSKYQVVYLMSVPDVSDEVWNKLEAFVKAGGGLAVILGDEVNPTKYNRAAAQQILPARLDTWQPFGDYRLSVDRREHPVFWKFRQYEDRDSFAAFQNDNNIYRFWKLVDRAGDSSVAASFTDADRSPALIDRPHGLGRTVIFATSMHLAETNAARWNDLPSPNKPVWQWLAFVEQLTGHLARATDWTFNVEAGQSVSLPLPPAAEDREYLLQRPSFAQTRVTVKANASTLSTSETRELGHYGLALPGSTPQTGFSVNAAVSESDLTRATEEQLEKLIGKGRVQIARTLDEIQADVNASRLGKEVFPLILLLAMLAFCGEHFVANWFYEADGERPQTGASTLKTTPAEPRRPTASVTSSP